MPAIALIFNAFVWGVSWFPFRQIESHGVHPVWATCLIYTAIALAMALLRRSMWHVFVQHPGLVLLGLAAGFTNVGFNWAVTQGDVVRVVLLFYLMPLWSVLLAWAFLGERPTLAALARVALALVGVAVVLKTPGDRLADPDEPARLARRRRRLQLRGDQHPAAPPARRAGRIARAGDVRRLRAGGRRDGAGGHGARRDRHRRRFAAPAWWGWALLLGVAFVFANVCLQYGAARLAASATSVIMLSEVLFASGSSVALRRGDDGHAHLDRRRADRAGRRVVGVCAIAGGRG